MSAKKTFKFVPIDPDIIIPLSLVLHSVRMLGSAAMQLVYVASGKYDFYLVEDLQPWDLAAGSILVKEAGGIVSNCDGSPYNVLGGSIAVAGTPELWETAVQAYKDADESSLSIE